MNTTKTTQFTPRTCQCRWSGAVNFVMCPLHTAAPAMYEALTNLLPEEDIVSTDNGPDECRWCGRTYPDNDNEGELQVLCTSDDCPGYMARQAIAQAEGQ